MGFCSDASQRRMSVTITTPASTLRLTPLRVTDLLQGLQTSPLPPPRARDPEVAHAPVRTHNLTAEEQRLAVRNALRYFPPSTHAELAPEFAQELAQYGHIYMYRFHGNIVDVWEEFVREYKRSGQLLVELGSDQTSCHNPFGGGYTPVQLNYEQASEMLAKDPAGFHQTVQESLRRHVAAVNTLADAGMYFFDYGNAFLLEARRAGADVSKKGQAEGSTLFRYPSYVQDIMGDIFSLGFGPFRWVCTSGRPEDLATTDRLAKEVLEQQVREGVPKEIEQQICDNIKWISEAGKHEMVVGSQARILYSDQRGRTALALSFNAAIAAGEIEGTIVISRDHHDVSGTDSPFRETSNIYDGSAFRGATWVSLH